MPYKTRLKTGEPRKRPKPTCRVTNARAYNQSLKRLGQLSLYRPQGDLKALFINIEPYVPGVSGRNPTCTNAYMELIYIFYRLFGWGMRQTDRRLHARVLATAGTRYCRAELWTAQ